jgi:hypothetical protein
MESRGTLNSILKSLKPSKSKEVKMSKMYSVRYLFEAIIELGQKAQRNELFELANILFAYIAVNLESFIADSIFFEEYDSSKVKVVLESDWAEFGPVDEQYYDVLAIDFYGKRFRIPVPVLNGGWAMMLTKTALSQGPIQTKPRVEFKPLERAEKCSEKELWVEISALGLNMLELTKAAVEVLR